MNRSRERVFFCGMALLMIGTVLLVCGLAVMMIPLGVLAAADELRRDLAAGPPYSVGIDPRTFSLVSVMGMVMVGTLITWSYGARRRPDVHKRMVLYETLSMIDAGSDRWPLEEMGQNHSWATCIYTALLLLPVIYDLMSLRRLHWVTMFTAPYVFLLHIPEISLGHTHAWHAAADLMLRFSRSITG